MSADPELRHPAWDLGPLPPKEPIRWRRGMAIMAGVVAVPLAAILVYAFAPATSFSSHALAYSVAGATDGHGLLESSPCARAGDGAWRCEAWSGSDNVSYLVEMDGSRCWHARRLGPGSPPPQQISACLKVRDQLRLWDRV